MRADESVGMVVDSLTSWDRLDRSMIIIFADHGEEFLEHGSIDHGQTVHEESIKVPLIVFCPGIIRGPQRSNQQVGLIDLGPTIFDALDLDQPPHFEGRSLLPMVSPGGVEPPSDIRPCGLPYAYMISEAIARRTEKKAIRKPPWKLIFDPFFGASGLYNLSQDPYERNNLLDARPDLVSDLTDTLLIMEKYYPGGWCVAWRNATPVTIRGRLKVDSGLLEAVGHNILPEIDYEVDSLLISEDWTEVYFRSETAPDWEGIEARMRSAADATFEMEWEGHGDLTAVVGQNLEPVDLPVSVSPSQAAVRRGDLGSLFARSESDVVIYWIEPGSDPVARQKKQEELKRQLKAVGYIE
jgi:hypothetical protein